MFIFCKFYYLKGGLIGQVMKFICVKGGTWIRLFLLTLKFKNYNLDSNSKIMHLLNLPYGIQFKTQILIRLKLIDIFWMC